MRYIFATTILLLALNGCCTLVVGDGLLVATGTAPEKGCEVNLLSEDKKLLPYTTQVVQGKFNYSTTVSPCPASYWLQSKCNGEETMLLKIDYKDKSWERPIEMGNIALQSNAK